MKTVILSGRFVYGPDVRTTSNGNAFISTRIAVSRNDKDKTTDFFNIKAWNKTAQFIGQYFHKGDPIEIRGRLETSHREDSNGNKSTEVYVLVDEVSFTLSKKAEPTMAEQAPKAPSNDMGQTLISEGVADLLPDEPGVLPFEL